MSHLRGLLKNYVDDGTVPGAVALVSSGGRVDVEAVGSADASGAAPMARDSIFRVASITKPITAAAAMLLVDEGRIALDDPIGEWLPELAAPFVVRLRRADRRPRPRRAPDHCARPADLTSRLRL